MRGTTVPELPMPEVLLSVLALLVCMRRVSVLTRITCCCAGECTEYCGVCCIALPTSCWGVAVSFAAVPAALTPLAGCRASPVEYMALNPPALHALSGVRQCYVW